MDIKQHVTAALVAASVAGGAIAVEHATMRAPASVAARRPGFAPLDMQGQAILASALKAMSIKSVELLCINPNCEDLANSLADALQNVPEVRFDFPIGRVPPGITVYARAPLARTVATGILQASGGSLPITFVDDQNRREGVVTIAFGKIR